VDWFAAGTRAALEALIAEPHRSEEPASSPL
jgi:hypothetical protein